MAFHSLWARSTRVSERDVSLAAKKRGFTLIELLVVCAIVVVVSTLVLLDNNKFGGDVTLENLAYDVALTMRQTQVYGIAVERFGTGCSVGSTTCFGAGYGMRFLITAPSTYYLFADLENTGVFDLNYLSSHESEASVYPQGEVVQQDTIQQGYQISSLSVVSSINSNATTSVNEIDVLYRRPEPEAYISYSTGNGAPVSCIENPASACAFEAQITLISPKGDTRTVLVDATGQISVQQ